MSTFALASLTTNTRAVRAGRAAAAGAATAALSTALVIVLGALRVSGAAWTVTLIGAWVVGTAGGISALGALLLEHSGRWSRTSRGGIVTVTPEAIQIDAPNDARTDRVPRASVRSGYQYHDTVCCHLDDGTELALRCATPEGAARLLEEAGLGVDARTATFTLRWRGWYALHAASLSVGLMLFTILEVLERNILRNGFEPKATPLLPMLAVFGIAALATGLAKRTEVVVGADGVRLPGNVFHPLAEVVSIERDDEDMFLVLRSGEHVRLGEATDAYLPTMRALAARIEQARARLGRAPEAALAALDRDERSPSAWVDALKKLSDERRPGAYRQVRVDGDTLARVLDDGAASADRRVAAAIALSALGEGATPRIRLAASASARPALRDALELAADGTLEDAAELAAALTSSGRRGLPRGS